jgi:hypothetical protein
VDLTRTRTVLHGVAELLLAGPQHAASGTIRLRVVPGGIGTVAEPDLRLEGTELSGPGGRIALAGTYAEAAAALGVAPQSLGEVYHDTAGVSADDVIEVDPGQLVVLLDALARGDAALRSFAPSQQPVLWPEHLDVAITVDEVNYGVSPGDAHIPEPYAYVGPWTARRGPFWNEPFGAARPLTELPDAEAVAGFFAEGAERARTDAVATERVE